MKPTTFAAILCLCLAACAAPAPAPTAAPTQAPLPSATLAPLPTATTTPKPLPAFMDAFVALGLDNQSFDGPYILAVLDEKATTFVTETTGKPFGQLRVFSWSRVYFLQDGALQSAFILNDFCAPSPYDQNQFFCYIPYADNITTDIHTVSYTRATVNWFFDSFGEGDYPIVKLEFDSAYFDQRNDFSNFPGFSMFAEIYPPLTGAFATFEIPGIGTVLPVTHVDFDLPETP